MNNVLISENILYNKVDIKIYTRGKKSSKISNIQNN